MCLFLVRIISILKLTRWSCPPIVSFSRLVTISMRSNSQFLGASVNKFIQIRALGGDANLNLSTHGGRTTVSFNCTIGQPSASHSLPPFPAPTPATPPPPQRPRDRSSTGLLYSWIMLVLLKDLTCFFITYSIIICSHMATIVLLASVVGRGVQLVLR